MNIIEQVWMTKVHPFTNAQARVILAAVNHGPSRKQIASTLHLSPETVKYHIRGRPNANSKSEKGILKIIEETTKIRPSSFKNALNLMQGDILHTSRL